MDLSIKTLIAFSGSAASFLFGGWTQLLTILLTFVVIDYATGVAAAAKEGTLKSSVGRDGIARKVMIFGLVAVAHLTDTALGQAHILRDATIFFYLTNELLSLIENSGRLGVPIPPMLMKAVEILRTKSGSGKEDDKQ